MYRHNSRYCSDCTRHWSEEIHTQYTERNSVLISLVKIRFIGPSFIEGTPEINRLFPEMNEYFQQDSASPHCQRDFREYLNAILTKRLIGRTVAGKITRFNTT